MKTRGILIFWMSLLAILLVGLVIWGIFFLSKTEHRLTIFGIVSGLTTAITSVLSVTLNNQKTKEREFNLLKIKETQKFVEHFYSAYFEALAQTSQRKGSKKPNNKVGSEALDFKKGLMIWGSEDLIDSYMKFETLAQHSVGLEICKEGGKFIKALRLEMGFNDTGKVNIFSMFLKPEAREELREKNLL